MSKFKIGDKVEVKKLSKDYHVSGMSGVYEVLEVIPRAKTWIQYEIGRGDNWERVSEEDIELTPDQGKE